MIMASTTSPLTASCFVCLRDGKLEAGQCGAGLLRTGVKVSGAVQAARWTSTADGEGYIYSFNGPHSLFIDTVRSLRSLAVADHWGTSCWAKETAVSLLQRLIEHAATTARYSIYYGEGRDAYDFAGRTAHECVFNVNDGHFRCPSSQQGYSPFSTWTRGLAWAISVLPRSWIPFHACRRSHSNHSAERKTPQCESSS